MKPSLNSAPLPGNLKYNKPLVSGDCDCSLTSAAFHVGWPLSSSGSPFLLAVMGRCHEETGNVATCITICKQNGQSLAKFERSDVPVCCLRDTSYTSFVMERTGLKWVCAENGKGVSTYPAPTSLKDSPELFCPQQPASCPNSWIYYRLVLPRVIL